MLSLIQKLQSLLNNWLGDFAYGSLLINLFLFVFASIVFWIVYRLVFRVFGRVSKRILKEDAKFQPLRIQKQEILSSTDVAKIINGSLTLASWIVRLTIVLLWLNAVLVISAWTRDVAHSTAGFARRQIGILWESFVDYIPDLITAAIIIVIAHLLIKLVKQIFEGIASHRIRLPGFYPEWSRTSFNLIRMLIIALTIVVVFPYLPGSGSPAFQGVSIFIGVLFSLGSTSAVANLVSGIVLTFTRAFVVGDYVLISGTEGRIIERTAFVTRIRTAKNVDVSIPNGMVMSDKVINFSTQAKNSGITLHTGITIGYDVSWVKVQELMMHAAAATEHIESEPAPYVLQTALDDDYVAYELNATTKRADLRPTIYSELHANLLNAFHGAGVEITSPQYRAIRDGNTAAMAPVATPTTAD